MKSVPKGITKTEPRMFGLKVLNVPHRPMSETDDISWLDEVRPGFESILADGYQPAYTLASIDPEDGYSLLAADVSTMTTAALAVVIDKAEVTFVRDRSTSDIDRAMELAHVVSHRARWLANPSNQEQQSNRAASGLRSATCRVR